MSVSLKYVRNATDKLMLSSVTLTQLTIRELIRLGSTSKQWTKFKVVQHRSNLPGNRIILLLLSFRRSINVSF